ncbi:MAG: GNAT family N-acetyltransferase [Patescibacteria group bacterium]
MNATIHTLDQHELDDFFLVFSQVLEDEFPKYTKKIVRYFLEKIYSLHNFRYWLTNQLKTILVAKDTEGMIVGFAVIDEPYGGVSLCRWLGVTKEYQNKGIGTALMRNWTELAQKQNCHKIEVAAQPKAKLFYEKTGLTLEGYKKLSYFGSDQYIYGKILGQPDELAIIR